MVAMVREFSPADTGSSLKTCSPKSAQSPSLLKSIHAFKRPSADAVTSTVARSPPTSGDVLYQGSSYNERTSSYDRTINLTEAIDLSWSLSGSGQSDEINFSKSLGVPNMTGTITLTHDTGNVKIININEFGKTEEQ